MADAFDNIELKKAKVAELKPEPDWFNYARKSKNAASISADASVASIISALSGAVALSTMSQNYRVAFRPLPIEPV